MKTISAQGNYIISSDFGTSIFEGTENAGTNGKIITFHIDQINPVYNMFYWQVQPITGQAGDFWSDFFSNKIGGEPADDFANSGYTSGDLTLKLNPDNIPEFDEKFQIAFYLSATDPGFGVAPVATATFTIVDDDPMVLSGGSDADKITSGSANDSLSGNAGNDILTGNRGDDYLDGGVGVDTMIGGIGNDIYIVDDKSDVVVELSNQGIDLVKSSVSYTLGANVENITLVGNAVANATGNALDNVLTGNAARNGLIGGAGNDTYVVQAGDKVIETLDGGIDTVQTSVTFSLAVNVENLVLTGSTNINGIGNTLANSITGNEGRNGLSGGAGNDTINGSLGSDKLIGGAGNDTFVFDTALGATNIDHITDFVAADDTIKLENAIFSTLTKVGGLSSAAIKDIGVSGTKLDADDRILYNHTNGVLYYDADGNGSSKAVVFAVLDTHPALTYQDFLIV